MAGSGRDPWSGGGRSGRDVFLFSLSLSQSLSLPSHPISFSLILVFSVKLFVHLTLSQCAPVYTTRRSSTTHSRGLKLCHKQASIWNGSGASPSVVAGGAGSGSRFSSSSNLCNAANVSTRCAVPHRSIRFRCHHGAVCRTLLLFDMQMLTCDCSFQSYDRAIRHFLFHTTFSYHQSLSATPSDPAPPRPP